MSTQPPRTGGRLDVVRWGSSSGPGRPRP